MQVLQAAIECGKRGWSVIPVPHRSKNPGIDGWQQLRICPETAAEYFNGQPQNIGLLLGEPSGWIVDVDLDHPRALELAPELLPPTPAKFGRPTKRRSHYLYRVTRPVATKKIRSKSAGMIVELRSTGQQTVIPPSTHVDGELIEWETFGAEPAEIDPNILVEAVVKLGDLVRIELGEKSAKKPKQKPERQPDPDSPLVREPKTEISPNERQQRCLAAMLRIGTVDQNDGSLRLFTVACRAVEHDLDDKQALQAIRRYAGQRPFAREWSDDDIIARLRDAERVCERGKALEVDDQGAIPLGNRDPATGKLILSPKRTLPTAEAFLSEFHLHPGGRTLHSYAGMLLSWCFNRFVELEEESIRKQLQRWLHNALRYSVNKRTGKMIILPFESNPATVKAAMETIRNLAHLPAATVSPSWLREQATDPPAIEILPCRSFLLHLPTESRIAPTPNFFCLNALEFDPDPNAAPPAMWFAFLHQLFDGDCESLDLLQEWFGYCLTGDTSQQKMLFMVGPRRSGKGTIARILAQIVGGKNVCGPTTSNLAGAFGLQPLIGKTLAIVSDARFSGENIATVVERLLCISGEDTLTVDRKYLTSVTMKLSTRFMFLSNELPRLNDASGALASRFMILRLTESFFGKEDIALTNKLLAERPGILNWGIEGLRRLRERGHFVMPSSAVQAATDLEELSSPISAFLRQECVVGAGHRVWVDDLYDAWCRWCEREGRHKITAKPTFGRDLSAAQANVVRRRGVDDRPFYEGIGLKDGVP